MFNLNDYPLPFRETELEPYMSAETIKFHYGKHLATYIANLNKLIADTKYANMDLREMIINSVGDTNAEKIFNNAAQIFNHEFFFNCMGRGNNAVPDIISDAFGGVTEFKEKFKTIANGVFGSGWVWLTHDAAKGFEIIATKNADTPIAHGIKPILTLDLWEHAYYLDFQNRRADFIETFLESLIDWKFVISNMNI
ncbi:MAG: superoxide dismutase [Alphaproteobacteria bacterium]|nr:superoxide dismutase [Alphaproteobacteria bacterium]MBR4806516.1 superoxide dismutase [Alphaproteobacteria bacterium]